MCSFPSSFPSISKLRRDKYSLSSSTQTSDYQNQLCTKLWIAKHEKRRSMCLLFFAAVLSIKKNNQMVYVLCWRLRKQRHQPSMWRTIMTLCYLLPQKVLLTFTTSKQQFDLDMFVPCQQISKSCYSLCMAVRSWPSFNSISLTMSFGAFITLPSVQNLETAEMPRYANA